METFFDGFATCECTGKYIIGRRAMVEFEGALAGVEAVAKVDTGAYSGSIHAEDINIDQGILSFRPFSVENPRVSLTNFRLKRVKSSNGHIQERYLIQVEAKINGHLVPLELTLASRSDMKYEMLLGRKNLSNNFIVDVSI